jgi:hypothetical protein
MDIEIRHANTQQDENQRAGENGIDDDGKLFHGKLLLCKWYLAQYLIPMVCQGCVRL